MDPVTPLPAVSTRPAVNPRDEKTAKEFEAVFIGQMTQLMLESVEQGEFSGGHGEEMFRGVLAEKMGSAIADRGGLGLAPAVLDQIIKMQGGTPDGH
ncbi:rod-binding protein [Stakelama sp. CBK3Z-3]|uniref:Rod-binding protein n=1 Tax=Stakelama flava TaxID=2860338 RepID=A0ABS6XJS8_9SPHN|nr:rod-binding protein [Stakelama flava]MBW4330411.1 rod-binding protein [Stakelama flava]